HYIRDSNVRTGGVGADNLQIARPLEAETVDCRSADGGTPTGREVALVRHRLAIRGGRFIILSRRGAVGIWRAEVQEVERCIDAVGRAESIIHLAEGHVLVLEPRESAELGDDKGIGRRAGGCGNRRRARLWKYRSAA